MKLKILTTLALLVLVGLAISYSNANETLIRYSTKNPFDMSIKKVPIGYKGDNYISLYEQLKNEKEPQKNEFETTIQYEKRIEAYNFNYLCIVKSNIHEGKYDADNEILYFKIEPTEHYTKGGGQNDICVDCTEETDSFVGQNSFGAIANVERHTVQSFYLSFVDNRIPNEIKLEIGLEEARKLKNKLELIVLFKPHKIDGEFVKYYSSISEATMKYPAEYDDYWYFIHAEFIDIWIFNKSTGEIIYKLEDNGVPYLGDCQGKR